MRSRRFVSIVTLCVAISAVCGAEPVALEMEFLSPPDSVKPLTRWHWLDGTITQDGITADLEAMKRAGLGGPRISAMTWSARCSTGRGTSHRQRSTQFTVTDTASGAVMVDDAWVAADGWGGEWLKMAKKDDLKNWKTTVTVEPVEDAFGKGQSAVVTMTEPKRAALPTAP